MLLLAGPVQERSLELSRAAELGPDMETWRVAATGHYWARDYCSHHPATEPQPAPT